MSLTDELCVSFRDLEAHFDPAQQGRLGRFDTATVREHLAAFRALEAGVEELEVEDAADEIDRTALLDDIRITIFRLQHERPHVRNPGFWLERLCEALAADRRTDGPTDGPSLELLRSVPAFLQAAEATIKDPPSILVDLGRALVQPAAELIAAHGRAIEGDHALRTAALAAEGALAGFSAHLESELTRDAEEHAPGVGEEQLERVLHFRYAARAGAGEVWRYVLGLIERHDGGIAREGRGGRPLEQVRARIAALEGPARELGFAVPDELPDFGELPEHRAAVEPLVRYSRAGPGVARFQVGRGGWYESMLEAVVAAGVVPGSHALARHAAGLRSRVRQTSTVGEAGFGLYALALLDEAGEVAERALLLYRAVLAQIDIGLHTGQLSLSDALKLLADRFPLEPREALAAVRGVLVDPGAATGAIVTRRELLRLRDDCRRALGAAFSYQRHHAELMEYGALPVSLVRWGLGVEE